MSSGSTKATPGGYLGNATERLANEQMQATPLIDAEAETAALKDLAKKILALPEGETPDIAMIQDGLSSFAKLYTARAQAGEQSPPFNPKKSMPVTVAMTTTSAMVSQVNIELFELGMWRLWSEK